MTTEAERGEELDTPDRKALKPQRQLFVDHYLTNGGNGRAAAEAAGYSPKAAHVQASKMLARPDVQAELAARAKAACARVDVSTDRILQELARLAFYDARKLFDDEGKPIHVSQLDDDTAATITGLDVVSKGNAQHGFAEIVKVKMADKVRALEMLGRYQKLFVDRVEVEVTDTLAERMARARQRKQAGG